jgi:hypothetical protein
MGADRGESVVGAAVGIAAAHIPESLEVPAELEE